MPSRLLRWLAAPLCIAFLAITIVLSFPLASTHAASARPNQNCGNVSAFRMVPTVLPDNTHDGTVTFVAELSINATCAVPIRVAYLITWKNLSYYVAASSKGTTFSTPRNPRLIEITTPPIWIGYGVTVAAMTGTIILSDGEPVVFASWPSTSTFF